MNEKLEEIQKQLDEIAERTGYIDDVLVAVHKIGSQYNFTSLIVAYEKINMQNKSIQQLIIQAKKLLPNK